MLLLLSHNTVNVFKSCCIVVRPTLVLVSNRVYYCDLSPTNDLYNYLSISYLFLVLFLFEWPLYRNGLAESVEELELDHALYDGSASTNIINNNKV